jgi:DDE superfamily endonuclease
LEFKRLPSYSPHLNVIERFWRVLRRRATHNRLFDRLADLKRSIRSSLCYFQTVRGAGPEPGRQVLRPPGKPESISGIVNQKNRVLTDKSN